MGKYDDISSEKVVAIVTDNGENMVAVVDKAWWRHYPCFANTQNVVVKDTSTSCPGTWCRSWENAV